MKKAFSLFIVFTLLLTLSSCVFDTNAKVICDHCYKTKTTGGLVVYNGSAYEVKEQVSVTKTCTKCGDVKVEKKDPTTEGVDYLTYENTLYLEDDNPEITSIIVPASFKAPGGEAKAVTKVNLQACTPNVDTVYLNESVTTIASSCFYQCYYLEEITIPSNATVENGAFSSCTGLRKLMFNGSVNLSPLSFGGCTALKDVDPSIVGSNVASFNECYLLLKGLDL